MLTADLSALQPSVKVKPKKVKDLLEYIWNIHTYKDRNSQCIADERHTTDEVEVLVWSEIRV